VVLLARLEEVGDPTHVDTIEGDVEKDDYEAIVAYKVRKIAHNKSMAEYARGMYAMLTKHATDENQKTGDVLEERGGRWVPKRQSSSEQDEA
jgi:hypothetical protein